MLVFACRTNDEALELLDNDFDMDVKMMLSEEDDLDDKELENNHLFNLYKNEIFERSYTMRDALLGKIAIKAKPLVDNFGGLTKEQQSDRMTDLKASMITSIITSNNIFNVDVLGIDLILEKYSLSREGGFCSFRGVKSPGYIKNTKYVDKQTKKELM